MRERNFKPSATRCTRRSQFL